MTVARLHAEMDVVELIRWEEYFARKKQKQDRARGRAARRRG